MFELFLQGDDAAAQTQEPTSIDDATTKGLHCDIPSLSF